MHDSLGHGQWLAMAGSKPHRPLPVAPLSAKVLAVTAAWIWLAWLYLPNVLAATPITQQSQAGTTAQSETTGQPVPASGQATDLSDEVVRDVLTGFQQGIETENLELVLASFDPQNMKDYPQFRDQMAAFFRRYDSIKLRYQLLQVSSDKDLGFATADIDMDADPSDILPTPQRRSTQMRFQMKRGPKGWKVVALQPADFFGK